MHFTDSFNNLWQCGIIFNILKPCVKIQRLLKEPLLLKLDFNGSNMSQKRLKYRDPPLSVQTLSVLHEMETSDYTLPYWPEYKTTLFFKTPFWRPNLGFIKKIIVFENNDNAGFQLVTGIPSLRVSLTYSNTPPSTFPDGEMLFSDCLHLKDGLFGVSIF